MRLLFLLLLLANLMVLAFPHLTGSDIARKDQAIAQRELHPDKVRMIGTPARYRPREARSQSVQEEQKNYLVAGRTDVPVCLQWTGIAAEDVNRSQAVLDSLGATYRVADDDSQSSELHWVYIPGLEDAAAVATLAERLRADGERRFTVSRRTAQGTYYISLGVFRSEEGARRQQKRFLRLGAVLEPLAPARTTYIVNDAGSIADKIGAAAANFEQTTVKQVDCPEIRTG